MRPDVFLFLIEIMFLLVVLPKQIRGLAKERNRSAFGWSIAAIIAMIGAQLLIYIGFLSTTILGILLFGWSEGLYKHPAVFVVDVIALIAGLLGAEVVRRKLLAKSKLDAFEE